MADIINLSLDVAQDLIKTQQEEKTNTLNELELKEKLKKENKGIEKKLKDEVFSLYKSIISEKMLEFFLNTYGANFDIKSLIDSIHYKTGNNLLPTFDYDSNNFVFGEQFAKNIREFNQNAVKETEYANIMNKGEYESYERGQFSNVYEDLTFDVNNERYYDSEKYFNPHNKMLQQGGYLNKEEAFAKAKLYAQTCFNEEYRKSIKKGLSKKYGVELK